MNLWMQLICLRVRYACRETAVIQATNSCYFRKHSFWDSQQHRDHPDAHSLHTGPQHHARSLHVHGVHDSSVPRTRDSSYSLGRKEEGREKKRKEQIKEKKRKKGRKKRRRGEGNKFLWKYKYQYFVLSLLLSNIWKIQTPWHLSVSNSFQAFLAQSTSREKKIF